MESGCHTFGSLRKCITTLMMLMLIVPGVLFAQNDREMVVMTRNLYFGADLAPAIEATTGEDFLGAVATIYGTIQATNFPIRAEAIADEIAATNPDIIGLQEAIQLVAVDSLAGTQNVQDYLVILQGELSERGLSYTPVVISSNMSIGPIPLVAPCTGYLTCFVSFTDRDVILVKNSEAIEILDSKYGKYTEQQIFETVAGPISTNHGWQYVDGLFNGKKFRFVNTHLDEEYYPESQQAQALEFLSGPAKTGGAVIAVGDFNSAADGSNTLSYAYLTHSYFDDAWNTSPDQLGYTCCQQSDLSNKKTTFYERIDLILTHGASRALSVQRVGYTPLSSAMPHWASDHAGVVSAIRIH